MNTTDLNTVKDLQAENTWLQTEKNTMRDIAQRLWQLVKEFDLNAEMDDNYHDGRVSLDQLHDWMVLKTECEAEFDGLHKPFLDEHGTRLW